MSRLGGVSHLPTSLVPSSYIFPGDQFQMFRFDTPLVSASLHHQHPVRNRTHVDSVYKPMRRHGDIPAHSEVSGPVRVLVPCPLPALAALVYARPEPLFRCAVHTIGPEVDSRVTVPQPAPVVSFAPTTTIELGSAALNGASFHAHCLWSSRPLVFGLETGAPKGPRARASSLPHWPRRR